MTTRTTPLVDLHDERACDAALVGVKAANLAVLTRAGFRVPDGVVIPHGITIDRTLLDSLKDRIGTGPFAVRSSATAEDLAEASYAGQYETRLGVPPAALAEAIAVCRESLHSARVAAYEAENGDGAMAVLVQPMLDPVAAGVAFSAHPLTGDRNVALVSAVAGLGESLVSGEATPDDWEVRPAETLHVSSGRAVIDPSQAEQVADLARQVEAHFGRPQDIEWAIAGGAIHLLQARPITALPEPPIEPIPIDIDIPDGSWEHDASHHPTPSHPIDTAIFEMVEEAIGGWAEEFGYLFDGIEFRSIGGWTYQRLRPIGGKDGPELPGWLMRILVRIVPMIRRRLQLAREAVATDKAGRFIRRWDDEWLPELSAEIAALKVVDLATLEDSDLIDHIAEARRVCTRGAEIHVLLHGAMAVIMYELVTTCEHLLGWDMATSLELVRGTSHKSTEPARRLHELATMMKSSQETLDLAGVAEREILAVLASRHPTFADAFAGYMAEFGEVALGQTVVEPTYAEMPSFLLARIRQQLATGFDPSQVDAHNEARRGEMVQAARNELAGDPRGAGAFERVLGRALEAYPVREDNEFYTFSAPLAQLRYALLEVGRRLEARGVIEARDDVFFLGLEEALDALAAPVDRTDDVRLRKGHRAWAAANPGPASYGRQVKPPSSLSFLPADARLPMLAMLWSLDSIEAIDQSSQTQGDGDVITGMAASAGTYTGPVRVVMGEWEFDKIQAGDVLVCPITSPVWSVIFPNLGALVTDSGGILSHPAIIAREYRLPAVVATGNATELLRDDEMVIVDGETGSITRV